MVPQDTFLFSDTIRENIAFGVENPDPEKIAWAVRVAHLEEDLASLPDGLDTMLGERGINLSGGQKQRVALARAILREPSILLLDDALSAVDTQTEERILANLREVMRTRTTIIVSHRISAVRDADLIVVLRDGEIAERGTHQELLALGGLYWELYEMQKLEEALEAI
jgi:ATP-binding cassette subfamily B protein